MRIHGIGVIMALKRLKRRMNQTAFDHWWINSNGGLGPLRHDQMSPHNAAEAGFAAGRKSVPTSRKLRKVIEQLLETLEDFDAGFDGFSSVNAAEKAVGRPLSKMR